VPASTTHEVNKKSNRARCPSGKCLCLESDNLTTVGASGNPSRESVDLGGALLNLGFGSDSTLAVVPEGNDITAVGHGSVLDIDLTLAVVSEWYNVTTVGHGSVLDVDLTLGDITALEGFDLAVLGLGWNLSGDVVDITLALLDNGYCAGDFLHPDGLFAALDHGHGSLLEGQGKGASTDGDGGDGNGEDSDDLGEEHDCFFV
jgi:hypothetical protein